MSVFSLSLDAIYASPIGANATFTAFSGTVRVVDKTGGEEVRPLPGGMSTPTVVPACMIRNSELLSHGITDPKDLVNTSVTFNGKTWTIINYKAVPQPGGEAEGEFRLTLRKPL